MKFGSVCSGIEAASVAWEPLGWKAAWFSEIENFPSAVLAHHYPNVPNLGDMMALPERIRSGEVEAPDILCGGTPCQAFSVAGSRNSLADARGNLSLTFCEIANAIDDVRSDKGDQPAIIFWENVPGVLSTKDNAFGCFLGELAGESCQLQPPGRKWANAGIVSGPKRTIAWRVLDAQYFGVAQRRRRVFVVASARTDIDPGSILFEFDRLRRDFAPCREKGQTVAALTANGVGTCGADDNQGQAGHLLPVAFGGGNCSGNIDVAATLTAKGNRQDFEVETFVAQPAAFSVAMRGREGGSACELGDDLAFTLRASSGGGDKPHVLQWWKNLIWRVRRLMPVECERLQGFPDNYTRIPYRNKPADKCPDGPRYKALGNSWAVPNVKWIGARIALAVAMAETANDNGRKSNRNVA